MPLRTGGRRDRSHSAAVVEPSRLAISVTAGAGQGRTTLSAFDAALRAAGVGDFNLVRLSSVIPPGSTVVRSPGLERLDGGFGDVLFCVYAESYATTPGTQACAGIGWAQRDGSGEGVFVEHAGTSREEIERDIEASLADMCASRGGTYSRTQLTVITAEYVDRPVCAVAVASYETLSWTRHAG
jgi:arginine decarboxylase